MNTLALDILRQTFGYENFRPNQAEVVDAALAGRDVLAVMPTSAGKSICYQVPAIALSRSGGGVTVVISPLISLMADQVGALRQYGIAASCLNSTLGGQEQDEVLGALTSGDLTLVYVAPERLDDPRFVEGVSKRGIALLAVDEAHCISQWGNDFRPSYQRIIDFINALPARPTVMALTATATQVVRDDISASLGLVDPYTVVASFDRPNLSFSVVKPKGTSDKIERLTQFCQARKDQSGIVYCSSRKAVEEVCDYLGAQGLLATRYHAGLSPQERERNQEDFLFDRARVMVATNAFGMGIDKSNVSYVAHYNLPSCVENYYQEAGRAGRDGTAAECVLFYSPADVHTQEFLISRNNREDLDPAQLEALLEQDQRRLKKMTFYATTTDCLRAYILRYFGERSPAYCGNCSNCLNEFEEVDATLDSLKIVSCVARLAQRGRSVGASTIVDILRGSRSEKVLLAGFDDLSTYGIMADVPVPRIRTLIDELAYRGLLDRAGGKFPTISLTNEGVAFMRARTINGEPLLLKVPKAKPKAEKAERSPRPSGARTRTASSPVDLSDADQALYQRLVALRTQLANEQQVPAYIIFNNASLVDMCAKRPTSTEEFLGVSGVGTKKAEAYAEKFLAAINGGTEGSVATGSDTAESSDPFA